MPRDKGIHPGTTVEHLQDSVYPVWEDVPSHPTSLPAPNWAPPLGTCDRRCQKRKLPKCSPGRASNSSSHPIPPHSPDPYSQPGCPPSYPKPHASFTGDTNCCRMEEGSHLPKGKSCLPGNRPQVGVGVELGSKASPCPGSYLRPCQI